MSIYPEKFDVIVVGAGHAGCEAAYACAKLGHKTLLFCLNLDTVAAMSCNPAIGGLAKGQIVREIDALGGLMGRAADACGIQFKMLNGSKGPAVRAPRAQCDKIKYRFWMKELLEQTPGLHLKQGHVDEILIDKDSATVRGVKVKTGIEYHARAVILTTGTFMEGLIHIGANRFKAGRAGDEASIGLSENLRQLGFETGRLKTGTNPRVAKDSIDISKMEEAPGDLDPQPFSHFNTHVWRNDALCWLTRTNAAVHDVIRNNFHVAPLYNGSIQGVGPRYCPSIEDKVNRFADKEWHQIFLEPEGLQTKELYLNGLATSLPEEVQLAFLRQIPGFEQVEIMRPGYAIEYDFLPPTQLKYSLETRLVHGLYFAGQINGTSGYEEAAAQGLIAGINASLALEHKKPVVLGRHEAYIGVLIDDLVTKGTAEPYRMFTSLAEYRLLLRTDNADLRLMDLGHALGMIAMPEHKAFIAKRHVLEHELARLKKTQVKPSAEVNAALATLQSAPLDDMTSLAGLLRRTEIKYADLNSLMEDGSRMDLARDIREQAEIQIKYEGYIQRQQIQVERHRKIENTPLPEDMDYLNINGLKREAQIKLAKLKPHSLGAASRISGVTPADITVLLVALEARRRRETTDDVPRGTNPG